MNNYVIVKYKSKQFKVGVGDIIDVDKIDSDIGDFIILNANICNPLSAAGPINHSAVFDY